MKQFWILSALVILTSCGGGSSSDGGQVSTTENITNNATTDVVTPESNANKFKVILNTDDERFYLCGAWVNGDVALTAATETNSQNLKLKNGSSFYNGENPNMDDHRVIKNLVVRPTSKNLDSEMNIEVCYNPEPGNINRRHFRLNYDVKVANEFSDADYATLGDVEASAITKVYEWNNLNYDETEIVSDVQPIMLNNSFINKNMFQDVRIKFNGQKDYNKLLVTKVTLKEQAASSERGEQFGGTIVITPTIRRY